MLLAIAGASFNAQAQSLTDEQITRLVERAKELTEQTAEAGHKCIGDMMTVGSASKACNTFRTQSDGAQAMYFRMKEAITANPYQNAYYMNADGINAAEFSYEWIRQSESTLIDMGLYDPRRH